jgi:ABC-type antimicrobial peptide transport system permease subunit
MAAILWKYTAREVQRRPGRTLLTLGGIVVGVATIVAITTTTRATCRSYRAMFDEVGGKAALEVVAPGQGGFDPLPVYEAVEGIDGVRGAVGLIQTRAGADHRGAALRMKDRAKPQRKKPRLSSLPLPLRLCAFARSSRYFFSAASIFAVTSLASTSEPGFVKWTFAGS